MLGLTMKNIDWFIASNLTQTMYMLLEEKNINIKSKRKQNYQLNQIRFLKVTKFEKYIFVFHVILVFRRISPTYTNNNNNKMCH